MLMSAVDDTTRDFQIGTGAFPPTTVVDWTGTDTVTTTDSNLFFNTTSNWDPVDQEAFKEEWKKLRLELLPLLLKDKHWNVLELEIHRKMDPKSKKVSVELKLKYEPEPAPKKGVRKTI